MNSFQPHLDYNRMTVLLVLSRERQATRSVMSKLQEQLHSSVVPPATWRNHTRYHDTALIFLRIPISSSPFIFRFLCLSLSLSLSLCLCLSPSLSFSLFLPFSSFTTKINVCLTTKSSQTQSICLVLSVLFAWTLSLFCSSFIEVETWALSHGEDPLLAAKHTWSMCNHWLRCSHQHHHYRQQTGTLIVVTAAGITGDQMIQTAQNIQTKMGKRCFVEKRFALSGDSSVSVKFLRLMNPHAREGKPFLDKTPFSHLYLDVLNCTFTHIIMHTSTVSRENQIVPHGVKKLQFFLSVVSQENWHYSNCKHNNFQTSVVNVRSSCAWPMRCQTANSPISTFSKEPSGLFALALSKIGYVGERTFWGGGLDVLFYG